MNLPDWSYRLVYRYGFRAARVVWRLTRPHHAGALVMLWHGHEVLLLRTSYQDVWTAPGGGIAADESPVEAAVRELVEEIGLRLEPEDLYLVLVTEHLWYNRHDRVHLFEVQAVRRSKLVLDNREVVEARFVTLPEAETFDLAPHLRDYFRAKANASSL